MGKRDSITAILIDTNGFELRIEVQPEKNYIGSYRVPPTISVADRRMAALEMRRLVAESSGKAFGRESLHRFEMTFAFTDKWRVVKDDEGNAAACPLYQEVL